MSNLNQKSVKFVEVVRYMTVNEHIPTKRPVEIVENGEIRRGVPVYKGAVWFVDDEGNKYVSFVNKSTKLWQRFREAVKGESLEISGKVKEKRDAETHEKYGPLPERYVLTHITF